MAYALETMIGAGETGDVLLAETTEVRGSFKLAIERIGPGVVRATDRPLDIAAIGYELQPAMAADVVEDTNLAIVIGDDEQRLTSDFDRCASTRLDELMNKTDEDPVLREYLVLFRTEELFTDIGALGKSRKNITGLKSARLFTNTDYFFND